MSAESSPGCQELFGELVFRGDGDARSVYSPAAHFVDLFALPEGAFDRPSLLERWPDLKQVLLDADNTFTEAPYLDIVNEVLERLFGDNPYTVLRKQNRPLSLPFSLDAAQLATYLRHHHVTPLELYRLFAPRPDGDIAREYLELCQQDVDVITSAAADKDALKARYGTESLDELR